MRQSRTFSERMLRNAAAKKKLCPARKPQRLNCSPSYRALTIYTPRLSRLKQGIPAQPPPRPQKTPLVTTLLSATRLGTASQRSRCLMPSNIMMAPKANLTNWHKDATSKPDRLKTILDKARDTVKILDQDVDYQPQPTHRLSAFLSGQPSTIIGQKCKNCTGCLQHCVSYDGPQPKWRPELAALRRKPSNQAMLCDVDVEPDSDEAANLRMETLANTFANDSAATRAQCLQAFLASRVSSGSQHLSPHLEDHPELRERAFVDPYPYLLFLLLLLVFVLFQVCFDCSSSCYFEFYGVCHFLEGDTQS